MKLNNQEIKEGYKVVNYYRHRQRYLSFTHDVYPEGSVEYKVKEWVQPHLNHGPLAVFKDYEEAKLFRMGQIHAFGIFKCFYVLSKQRALWFPNGDQMHIDSCPRGTDLADAVYLVEERK